MKQQSSVEPRPAPGSIRPGGRTGRTREAVLAATRAELEEGGYAELSVERIAERAGVSRSTIYRRWGDVDGLVTALMQDLVHVLVPLPDTGNLQNDLTTLARGIARAYMDPIIAATVAALIAASVRSPGAGHALERFFTARNEESARVLQRGVDRGEAPAGTDGVEVARAVGAPFYYRMLVLQKPIDLELAEQTARMVIAATDAGVFVSPARNQASAQLG